MATETTEMSGTSRRFTATLLILGGVLFQVGAFGPLTSLTNSNGVFVYSLPLRDMLAVISARQTIWWWTNAIIIVSSLVTLMGLALLAQLLREHGDRRFSPAALLLLSVGTTLWIVLLLFRLSITPWAAHELASTGEIPDIYVPLSLWTQALFVTYTVLAFSALALYGGSALSSRLLPQWVGWLALVYGIAGLGVFAIAGDVPPFLHYLPPILMGALLLRRSQGSAPQQTQGAPSQSLPERQLPVSSGLTPPTM